MKVTVMKGPKISFHHYKIDHYEAEKRLRSSQIDNSFLTRECTDKRGLFILSYMVNLSCIKHFIIPYDSKSKVKHQLKIDDLYTEVISVTDSIKECKFPLVLLSEESEQEEAKHEPEPEISTIKTKTVKQERKEVKWARLDVANVRHV